MKRTYELPGCLQPANAFRSTALSAWVFMLLSACNLERTRATDTTHVASSSSRQIDAHDKSNGASDVALDSLAAAQIAIRVSREAGVTVPIAVSSFRRDSLGYTITTSPTNTMVAGGETLVRVYFNGNSEVIQRFQ